MFRKLTDFLENRVQPAAAKMSQNAVIQAITHGMMGIITINIGVSLVSIIVNLPIQPWLDFLGNSGLLAPAKELINATTSLISLYIVFSIAYSYAKIKQEDPKAASLIAVAVFMILLPQTIVAGETTVAGISLDYLGSNGIFVAILTGIISSMAFVSLMKRGVKLKMPEQVPSMVVDSMSPIITAMIIFTGAFLIKYGLTLTSHGNIFKLFYSYLTAPAMVFGMTGLTPILWVVFRAIFWFFGIHPSPLNAIFLPLSAAATAANVDAFLLGQSLPYLDFAIMSTFGLIGGTGCTFALGLNMFSAKSERYKALNKLAFIPGAFNINEPYVFGVPLMYNPLMLIPMVLAPIAGSLVAYAFLGLNLINSSNFNPSVTVAWVIPYPIAAFLRGGFWFLLAVLVAIVLQYFIYKPFFNVIDKQALLEEQGQ